VKDEILRLIGEAKSQSQAGLKLKSYSAALFVAGVVVGGIVF
jgi:hypothetical protein